MTVFEGRKISGFSGFWSAAVQIPRFIFSLGPGGLNDLGVTYPMTSIFSLIVG